MSVYATLLLCVCVRNLRRSIYLVKYEVILAFFFWLLDGLASLAIVETVHAGLPRLPDALMAEDVAPAGPHMDRIDPDFRDKSLYMVGTGSRSSPNFMYL